MRAVTQPWEYSRGAPSIKPAIPRTNTNNLLFFNFIFGRAVFAVFLPSHNRFGMKRCLAGANRRKQVAITYQACGRRKRVTCLGRKCRARFRQRARKCTTADNVSIPARGFFGFCRCWLARPINRGVHCSAHLVEPPASAGAALAAGISAAARLGFQFDFELLSHILVPSLAGGVGQKLSYPQNT